MNLHVTLHPDQGSTWVEGAEGSPGQPRRSKVKELALPGLEPGAERSVDGRPGQSMDAAAQIPGGCEEGAGSPMAVDGRLRPGACSNVARALRDLLEHAKRSGLDPAHPALRAAGAALEEYGANR